MRVDFYRLNRQRSTDSFVCRLSQKLYSEGKKLYIHAESAQRVNALDQLLWTFNDIAFVPHNIVNNAGDDTPIVVAYQQETSNMPTTILNLAADIPTFIDKFERILEVVTDEPMSTEQGRAHYRHYQQQGYELRTHQI